MRALEAAVDLNLVQGNLTLTMAGEQRPDISALVRAAQSGDRRAFARLHEQFAGMVHGILLARVPRGEVEDLMQDVFLTAMNRLPSLREQDAFGGWLAAIARNRATDYHRRSRETEELTDDMGATGHDDQEARRVLNLIRTLPEAYRETLILRFVEGLTGPEIAERTGLTPGSVRVNLHRGITMLRERLGVTS
ncbi:MAG: sigma-70 family RNA polymerase sigma factor [Candidatus Zixiibacteriota bacterium]